jgi:hypothetical protein
MPPHSELFVNAPGIHARSWRRAIRCGYDVYFPEPIVEQRGWGLVRAGNLLSEGWGIVLVMNHFSKREMFEVFREVLEHPVFRSAPIIVPVAYHHVSNTPGVLLIAGSSVDL